MPCLPCDVSNGLCNVYPVTLCNVYPVTYLMVYAMFTVLEISRRKEEAEERRRGEEEEVKMKFVAGV